MHTAREDHSATLLPDGKVLIAGGYRDPYALASVEVYDPQSATFTSLPEMATARAVHTATLLGDGKVLIAGGWYMNSGAELYDAGTGDFTPTGSMATPRYNHTATLLANGKVLIAGGMGPTSWMTDTAELYDPDTGTFTPAGLMGKRRSHHTATLLPNGKVLIAGGYTPDQTLSGSNTAELFDPDTATFTPTSPMLRNRYGHLATLLLNGKVLIAGPGPWVNTYSGAELYDPATGTFTATAGFMLSHKGNSSATLLPNGKVLFPGGQNIAKTEVYDPATDQFRYSSNATPRDRHSATLLPDGKVLIAGGNNYPGGLATAELFDPEMLTTIVYYEQAPGGYRRTGDMQVGRKSHTATLLPNGRVLVAGGDIRDVSFPPFASAELYHPETGTFTLTGSMGARRTYHTATLLPNGKVLVAGGVTGFQPTYQVTATAELY
jgi:WD40 repeat protein